MFSNKIIKNKLIIKHMVRFCNSFVTSNFSGFSIEPKFNNSEQEKILNILNESSKDELKCLKVPESKIRMLENYKKRNGPFKSIDELLEVDGLSVKMSEKLCKQVISDTSVPVAKQPNNDLKRVKQIITPQLVATYDLTSAVGIHVAPMGVSWAKIIKSTNQLESWGYDDFTNLPKKMFSSDTFKLAMNILNRIPTGDVYIFEGTSNMGVQKQSAVPAYTQQLELCSMLLALINTSSIHNPEFQKNDSVDVTNCVYFLRSKLPARLFKTLVGNECVSSTATILQLLGESDSFTLPCNPITFIQKLKNDYLAQSSVHKELLGQSLMLTVAFMDLCVVKNPVSFKAIAPNRK